MLSSGRFVPPKGFPFPKRTFGDKVKKVNSCLPQWFETFSWLHYDMEQDVVTCLPCSQAHERSVYENISAEVKSYSFVVPNAYYQGFISLFVLGVLFHFHGIPNLLARILFSSLKFVKKKAPVIVVVLNKNCWLQICVHLTTDAR